MNHSTDCTLIWFGQNLQKLRFPVLRPKNLNNRLCKATIDDIPLVVGNQLLPHQQQVKYFLYFFLFFLIFYEFFIVFGEKYLNQH